MTVVELRPGEGMVKTVLGVTDLAGQGACPTVVQHVVRAGTWFGSYGNGSGTDDESWSLVGCTVAPGFDFADFELASRSALMSQFGGDSLVVSEIERLTEGLP